MLVAGSCASAPKSEGISRVRRARLIHRLEAMRNNHARGWCGGSVIMPRVTNARDKVSCAMSSASQGLRVRWRQYR